VVSSKRMGTSVAGGHSLAPLLHDAEAKVPVAKERLFSTLYRELHQLAERQLRRGPGITLSATTLLHGTYIGLVGAHPQFLDPGPFMSYAARVMRNLIIDLARQRRAKKRGANFYITQLDSRIIEQHAGSQTIEPQLVRLSEALDELAVRDARLAEVVDLKYFCGFTFSEIAALRGVSDRTVERDWEKARIVLYQVLNLPQEE